jgi:hypothetical protein
VPVVKKSALVRHSAEQMFDLVADVEGYPEISALVSCDRSCCRADRRGDLRPHRGRALGVRQVFSTCNRLDPAAPQIDLMDGPFRKLTGAWTFTRCARMPARSSWSWISSSPAEADRQGLRRRCSARSPTRWWMPSANVLMRCTVTEEQIKVEVAYAREQAQALLPVKGTPG